MPGSLALGAQPGRGCMSTLLSTLLLEPFEAVGDLFRIRNHGVALQNADVKGLRCRGDTPLPPEYQ